MCFKAPLTRAVRHRVVRANPGAPDSADNAPLAVWQQLGNARDPMDVSDVLAELAGANVCRIRKTNGHPPRMSIYDVWNSVCAAHSEVVGLADHDFELDKAKRDHDFELDKAKRDHDFELDKAKRDYALEWESRKLELELRKRAMSRI